MPEPMSVAQGLGGSWTATIRGEDGKPFTSYTGSELLAGTVRIGRDQAALFSFTPTWLSAAAGTITIAIAGSATTGLDVGRYLVQITLADDTADLFEGYLEVTYSPGTAPVLTSYGSFADILDRASWIEKLQAKTDLAGLARQRYLARRWFEDLLHRHYRGNCGFATDTQFGFYFFGRPYRDGRRSKELQDWLDDDRLDVTDQVIEAVSCYAIGLVCDRQPVVPGKDANNYAKQAQKFFARAENAASNITAELDTDGDGTNDLTIRLGLADTLEG